MRKDDVNILKATSRDIGRIIEIEQTSYKDPWPKEIFMIDYLFNNSSLYFVLKEGSFIAGFLGIWIEENELHVINIAVDHLYRKKGYGKLMLEFAVDIALKMGLKNIYLETRKSNLIAQKLYATCGFVPIEELKSYYQDGEDGIRMSKDVYKGEK